MKDSAVVTYIKKLFGIKTDRDKMTDDERIGLDYFECICYLYKGKEIPVVTGFQEGVPLWLETSVGLIELDCIPHDEGHLTNNVYELEALIGENHLEDSYVISLINQKLEEKWNR